MEKLSKEVAEQEAEKIREFVGDASSKEAYKLADKLINAQKAAKAGSSTEEGREIQISQLKQKLKEAGDTVILEPSKVYPKTMKELFVAIAPESVSGTEDEIFSAGIAAFEKWFLSTRKLSATGKFLKIMGFEDKLKMHTRTEEEIVSFLISHGLSANEEDARFVIDSLCKNLLGVYTSAGYNYFQLKRFRNETGEWLYSI